jgi:predicted Zn-dependent protease
VNAFALPGGYIYVTRGILPFLNDERSLPESSVMKLAM